MNATLVGVCTDAIIGNAHSHPHCAFGGIAFADHFEDPSFVGIGHGKRFALRSIAVVRHQIRHHADGLACSLGTLQSERHERHIVDAPHGILRPELFAAAESRLGDGYLVLIDIAYYIISIGCLRNFAEGLVRVSIHDLAHRAGGVFARGIMKHASIHAVGIGTVSDETSSVFRSFLAYQQIGAGRRREGEQYGEQGEESIHLPGNFNFRLLRNSMAVPR